MKKRLGICPALNFSCYSVLFLGPLIPLHSVAEVTQLEEVVVTAQKREEALEDVPISITAVTGQQLEDAGITNVRDLPNIVPGMRIDQQGAFTQPTIRGVGSSTAGAGMTSNVATYVDGFYVPSQLGTSMEFLNIQSVQVLKGPQGTLFGRNATGGAILLETTNPSFETVGEVQASYSRYNKQRYKFYASTGLTDTLAVDIAGVLESGDGHIENIVTGDEKSGEYDKQSYRASMLYELTADLSIELALAYSDIDDPLTNNKGVWRGITTAYDQPGVIIGDGYLESSGTSPVAFTSETKGAYLTIEKNWGDITLKSYTMQHDEENYAAADADATNIDRAFYNFSPENESFSQEFQLTGSTENWDWVLGAFYMEYTENFFNLVANGVQYYRMNENDITSMALFADATYRLTDRLYLTAGVRTSEEEATAFVDSAIPPLDIPEWEGDWSSTTPRVVLRYEPTDDSSVYASYTEGFRAGTLNPASFNTTPVDPEEITSYEVGYKRKTGSNRVELSAYTYDFKDMQVSSYLDGQALVTNAASSSIWGVDLQFSQLLGEHWLLNLGASYIDAEYDEFPGSQARNLTLGPGLLTIDPNSDASGLRLLRSPRYTANMGIRYETDLSYGRIVANANAYLTDDFYFDSNEQVPQDGYTLVNLRAAWFSPSEKFDVALFLNNATNEEYYTQVLLVEHSASQSYGEPRSLGVSVGYRF